MACDHKFVDSRTCLKCGWGPPVPVHVAVELDEALAETTSNADFLAGELRRLEEEVVPALTAERDALLAEKRTRRETDEQVMGAVNQELEQLQVERDALKARFDSEGVSLDMIASNLEWQRRTNRLSQAAGEFRFAICQSLGIPTDLSLEEIQGSITTLRDSHDALKAERDAFMWAKEQNMVAHAAELASAESARDQAAEAMAHWSGVAGSESAKAPLAESARDQAVEKLGEERAAVVHWVEAFNRASLRVQSAEQALRALRDAATLVVRGWEVAKLSKRVNDMLGSGTALALDALEKALEE